jgi:hypothetical protein
VSLSVLLVHLADMLPVLLICSTILLFLASMAYELCPTADPPLSTMLIAPRLSTKTFPLTSMARPRLWIQSAFWTLIPMDRQGRFQLVSTITASRLYRHRTSGDDNLPRTRISPLPTLT